MLSTLTVHAVQLLEGFDGPWAPCSSSSSSFMRVSMVVFIQVSISCPWEISKNCCKMGFGANCRLNLIVKPSVKLENTQDNLRLGVGTKIGNISTNTILVSRSRSRSVPKKGYAYFKKKLPNCWNADFGLGLVSIIGFRLSTNCGPLPMFSVTPASGENNVCLVIGNYGCTHRHKWASAKIPRTICVWG